MDDVVRLFFKSKAMLSRTKVVSILQTSTKMRLLGLKLFLSKLPRSQRWASIPWWQAQQSGSLQRTGASSVQRGVPREGASSVPLSQGWAFAHSNSLGQDMSAGRMWVGCQLCCTTKPAASFVQAKLLAQSQQVSLPKHPVKQFWTYARGRSPGNVGPITELVVS